MPTYKKINVRAYRELSQSNTLRTISSESGKRLYVDVPDKEQNDYQHKMRVIPMTFIDRERLAKHSELLKPYYNPGNYQGMEYQAPPMPPWTPPNFPPEPPLTPPGEPPSDCKVGYRLSGILDGWLRCLDEDNCVGYIFTCAHKLISVQCLNCRIDRIEPLPGDEVLVVICSDENEITVDYWVNEGEQGNENHKFTKSRECVCEDADEACITCDNCTALSIGYTTQQMSCDGSQLLTATGGAGCYEWSLTGGGGALSAATGKTTTYTAPSSNANCANNPTIQLKDYCGTVATLKIAVNCADLICANEAMVFCFVDTEAPVGLGYCVARYYCDGSKMPEDCGSSSVYCQEQGYTSADYVTSEWQNCCGTYGLPTCGFNDVRSAALKTAGCCPAQLL